MRGDPSAKVGDKGIIEEISPLPAKIVFSSEEVKKQIIEQPEKLFLVDVQAKAAEVKVRLYQIFKRCSGQRLELKKLYIRTVDLHRSTPSPTRR